MAVIVEQEGNPNYYKVQCNFCNSILKYLPSNEIQINNMDGHFGPETIWSVICPVCGTKVITHAISEDEVVDYRIK